jgi:hypothetical protein
MPNLDPAANVVIWHSRAFALGPTGLFREAVIWRAPDAPVPEKSNAPD